MNYHEYPWHETSGDTLVYPVWRHGSNWIEEYMIYDGDIFPVCFFSEITLIYKFYSHCAKLLFGVAALRKCVQPVTVIRAGTTSTPLYTFSLLPTLQWPPSLCSYPPPPWPTKHTGIDFRQNIHYDSKWNKRLKVVENYSKNL